VRRRYRVLGTDGFGRSDYRKKLRHFFEVDRHWVVLAALESLTLDGALPASRLAEAIRKYDIDPDKPNPAKV
jgi:pyruvate dehydrogenase E1 component